MSKHPEVLWAQRSSTSTPEKNIIYLTVNLPNIVEASLEYKLTSTGLSFKATTSTAGVEQTEYAFGLDLYAEVDEEKSTSRLTSRSLVVVLRKKELNSEYWPRLTKEKLKTPYIKTDFGKWVDEDDQDGNPEKFDDDMGAGGIPGMDGLDMGGMGGMGGLGGMGGMGGSGMDFSKMMEQAGGNLGGGFAPVSNDPVESDSDEDGPPPLEEAEPTQ
ncbi:HSP20-like chaperone [Imleria badia]|nr:HSP20-like chaperone [Imleria badia]